MEDEPDEGKSGDLGGGMGGQGHPGGSLWGRWSASLGAQRRRGDAPEGHPLGIIARDPRAI